MACTSHDSDGGGGGGCGGCGGACSCDSAMLLERANEGAQSGPRLCVKCKERFAALAVGNQSEPMCADCLHASVLAKFKTAVNNNGLVSSSDKVLVAFSGGPASRAAIELLKEIRLKAKSNAGAARDRGLSVFELGAVFVDERTVLQLAPADAEAGIDEISSVFTAGNEEDKIRLHVVATKCIFDRDGIHHLEASANSGNGELNGEQDLVDDRGQKLLRLVEGVKDATGREDLLEYLRMQAIQKVAQENGYTKVILGLCTTRIAARVIAATSKGRGYSLSADIQYLDARWPVPVALPLRDCTARELALFCHFSKLKTVFVKGLTTMADPQSSLNNLAHAFITLLQEENPSREHTIVRTAAKLKSFAFNEVSEPPNRRRRHPQAWKNGISTEANANPEKEIMCPICCSPVRRKDIENAEPNGTTAEKRLPETESNRNALHEFLDFRSTCCPSCSFQILPADGQNTAEQYGLLPRSMKEKGASNFANQQKWMRSQIDAYLLPGAVDSEE